MTNLEKLFAVEWNPSGKNAHIQYLSETIAGNIHHIIHYEKERFVPEYLLVAITESEEEAHAIANRIEKEFG